MVKRNKRGRGNPDFRHRVPGPMPSVAEIEAELTALLTPALFAPRHLERRDPRNPERLIRLRARILTLPVMVALIVSLVWRRLGAIAEVQRVVVQDGLLWVSPLQVSEQAIAKRLDTLPARALAAVFTEVSARLQGQSPPQLPGLEKLGRGPGALFPHCHGRWLDARSAAQKNPDAAGSARPRPRRPRDGDGRSLYPSSPVATLYRRCGGQ